MKIAIIDMGTVRAERQMDELQGAKELEALFMSLTDEELRD